MRNLILLLIFATLGKSAFALELNVKVIDSAGAPVVNAVVMVPAAPGVKPPSSFAWPSMMEQKDIAFSPYILVVPVGSEVQFPNRDRVRHHVYSRHLAFKTPGVVAVGCNIHDEMIGYIRVVDTPYAAFTDAKGVARLAGLKAAKGSMTVWHPDLAGGKDIVVPYDSSQTETVVNLDGKTAKHAHH